MSKPKPMAARIRMSQCRNVSGCRAVVEEGSVTRVSTKAGRAAWCPRLRLVGLRRGRLLGGLVARLRGPHLGLLRGAGGRHPLQRRRLLTLHAPADEDERAEQQHPI